MSWGNYRGTHYSGLRQITTANAGQLQAAWTLPMPGPSVLEAVPLVVDGVMYATAAAPVTVIALDARTGRQIWRYARPQKLRNPYEINPFNRGVAVLGNRLFVGTLDAALIALDARTGLPLWEAQVADTMDGYSLTSPPLVVKDKVLVGITGGEFATRGFLDAYDAATRQAGVALLHGSRPGRVRPRHVEGRQLEETAAARRGSPAPTMPSSNTRLLDRRQSGDRKSIDRCAAISTTSSATRSWRSIPTPASASGTTSSRRTTATTGIPREDMILVDRVWRGQMRKLLLHADRNGISTSSTARTARSCPARRSSIRTGTTASTPTDVRIAVPGSNSSRERQFLRVPDRGRRARTSRRRRTARVTGWVYLEYSENGQAVRQRAGAVRGGPAVHRRAAAAAGASGSRRPGEPPPQRRHQGARSGDRKDGLGLQDRSRAR